MDTKIAAQLIALNRQFYQTFARSFSETRQRSQPGILRALRDLQPQARILDLGCGNGSVAHELAQRSHKGPYVGLDFSEAMLIEARRGAPPNLETTFIQADLAAMDWPYILRLTKFDVILAFAVLHHIPGENLRREILKAVHGLLTPQGQFTLSNWQFLNSPRLSKRVQPWETIEMSQEDVDPGDYLLDWRRDGYGFRYVHHFSVDELSALAEKTGFEVLEAYHSDGEGGRLGLYQVWTPISS